MQIEDVLRRQVRAQQIAPGGVHDALGLARGARRVQDEKRLFRGQRGGRAVGAHALHRVVPPEIAPRAHRDRLAGAANDDAAFDGGSAFQGGIDIGLQRQFLAAPIATIGRDAQFGPAIVDPITQRIGRESAEDDGVRGPHPGARQHRHHRLRDHGHVDRDAIASHDALREENVREPTNLGMELAVRHPQRIAGLALPDHRRLVAARGQVPVQAVDRHVQGAAVEPARERRLPVEHPIPAARPGQLLTGHLRPEALGIFHGASIEVPVGPLVEQRPRHDIGRGRETAPCAGDGLNDAGALVGAHDNVTWALR